MILNPTTPPRRTVEAEHPGITYDAPCPGCGETIEWTDTPTSGLSGTYTMPAEHGCAEGVR